MRKSNTSAAQEMHCADCLLKCSGMFGLSQLTERQLGLIWPTYKGDKRMRAVIIETPGKIRVGNVADPTPKPDELVIRVGACGICGTDLHIANGNLSMTRRNSSTLQSSGPFSQLVMMGISVTNSYRKVSLSLLSSTPLRCVISACEEK